MRRVSFIGHKGVRNNGLEQERWTMERGNDHKGLVNWGKKGRPTNHKPWGPPWLSVMASVWLFCTFLNGLFMEIFRLETMFGTILMFFVGLLRSINEHNLRNKSVDL